MNREWQQHGEMIEIGRRIWDRGLVAATDGNLSIRLDNQRLLITRSGCSLGELTPVDLVVMDYQGVPQDEGRQPSSEYRLHLMVYLERPDVHAIVHAHPPIANAFSFAGLTMDELVVPEVVFALGRIPTTAYATPSTAEGAAVARELIRGHDALLLQRHGSVTVGPSLQIAYQRLEKIEHTAQILLGARLLGRVQTLSADELAGLAALRATLQEKSEWG